LARWLLSGSLPIDDRDAIIGDLDEEYCRHALPERGWLRARGWYWRQAVTSLPWLARRGDAVFASPQRPSFLQGPAQAARDLRYGVRSLRNQPGFTAAAVVTLALGIGANTAIFTIVEAVLLRPLPYREPGRLVHIYEIDRAQSERRGASYPEYLDWRRLNRTFEEIAGHEGGSRTLTGDNGADRVPVAQVTGNFFRALGVNPHLGRAFEDGEDGRDAASIVMLTFDAWQRRFNADPAIVGDTIDLNGAPHVVVGVLPADFEFALRGNAELYLPLWVSSAQEERRYQHWLDLIGRLRDGVTIEQAEVDLSALATAVATDVGAWHAGVSELVVPLRDEMVASVRPALLVLLAAVGVVLLATCANVAGLLLARSARRRRELGIRAALGAGRRRLLQQLLTESLVLAFAGGAVGLVLGSWGLTTMIAAMPERQRLALPHVRDLSLDTTMIAFALGLTVLTAVLVGLVPAWRAAGGDVQGVLRQGGRAATGRLRAARPALVGAEVMLAVVLVAGAGMLAKSLVRLLQVSPGFDPNGVLTLAINLPGSYDGASGWDARLAFHRDLLARVGALPGVTGAGTINQLPFRGRGNTGTFTVEGEPLVGADPNPEVSIRTVSAGYFRALGVPLFAGREIGAGDDRSAPPVVVVNETLAARYFPDRGPLGRRIVFSFFEGQPAWEIVGIVGDERFGAPDEPTTPVVYFPYRQTPDGAFSLVVRTAAEPLSLVAALRAEVAALDPELPIYDVATMNGIAAGTTAIFLRRYVLLLVGGFAAVALLLAAVGLYGVMSQAVVERTREIGVRVALGADRGDVVRMVVGQGMVPAIAGLVAGIAVALAALRLLGSLLYDVQPHDPAVLAAVILILAAVALLSCWLPARRATRIDPIVSLQAE
jgi:predicted permease